MHYIKTEQKDRVHTINHYQHIQESDPVEAESIRSDVADHLRGTDQRVTKAVDMLGQLPKYEKKIRTQIGWSPRFVLSMRSRNPEYMQTLNGATQICRSTLLFIFSINRVEFLVELFKANVFNSNCCFCKI